jgi:hypothetical protein
VAAREVGFGSCESSLAEDGDWRWEEEIKSAEKRIIFFLVVVWRGMGELA